MRVADKAGVTAFISRLLSPVTRVLFPGLKKESKALRAVCMNITANLLGLGNAATPFGIEAMRHLSEEGGGEAGVANNHMIMLVVLNTASIQLLPTTIATLRLKHGSVSPLDILPPILVASFVSVLTGILMVKLFACKDRIFHHERKGKKNVNPGRVRKQGAI